MQTETRQYLVEALAGRDVSSRQAWEVLAQFDAGVRAEEALRQHHYQRDFALRQEFCEICRVALAAVPVENKPA